MSENIIMRRRFKDNMAYEELLSCYSVADLKSISNRWNLSGISKFKKNELVEALVAKIDQDIVEKLLMFNLDHFSFITSLLEGKNESNLYREASEMLIDLGLVLEGKLEDNRSLIVSNIVSDKFEEHYNNHNELIMFNTIYKDYLDLATSLYGVVSVEDFVDMFYMFNEESISKEMLNSVLEYTVNNSKNTLLSDGLLHYFRLDKYKEMYDDIQARDDASYNIIDSNMIQAFINDGGCIWTEHHSELQEYLEKNFEGNRATTLDLVDEMKVMLGYNHSISDFIQIFSKSNPVDDISIIKEFADIIFKLNNVMPHFELKGNMPSSLSKYKKQEPIVKGDKIKRNDSCPCGSGKKYKKCCLNK